MQKMNLRTAVTKILIVLWTVLCLYVFVMYVGSYSIVHGSSLRNWSELGAKLARVDLIGYTASLAAAFLGMLIFCAAGLLAGAPLLPYLMPQPGERTSALAFLASLSTAFMVGQGALSAIFLTLAELNQLLPLYVALTLMAATAIGLTQIKAVFSMGSAHFEAAHRRRLDWDDICILIPALTVVVLTVLYSTSRLSYDSVALYFSDAKITAMARSVRYFMDDSFVASIFHTGIQYAALIQLFGDQAARLYSWVSGVVVMLFSVALAEELGLSRKARLVTLALIVSTIALLDLMGDGKVDLASTAPAIAAIYWLVVSARRSSKWLYLLTGFLAGMAMAARPFNIFLVASIMGFFEIQIAWFRPGSKGLPRLGAFLQAVGFIALGTLPWLAYHLATNWIILGDPLAFIKNYEMVTAGVWQWSFAQNEITLFRVIYPITVTFLNTPQSLGTVSPLFLGLLPLFLLRSVRASVKLSRPVLFLVVAAASTLVLWILITFLVFEIRYILFLWIILFMPLAALVGAALEDEDLLLRNFPRLAFLSLLAFLAIRAVYISIDSYSPVDSRGNAHCDNINVCDFLAPVNAAAQEGDRVLTLNAFRYYLRQDLFACSTTHSEYSLLERLSRSDSLSFWTEIYREGYSYATIENNYSVRHLYMTMIPGPANAPPWIHLIPIYGTLGAPEVSYKIEVVDPPPGPRAACQRDARGLWQVSPLPQ